MPYGIRESALKIGSKKAGNSKIAEEHLDKHTPQKIDYNLDQLVKDLLNFTSFHLHTNSRLVFFYPINKSTYNEQDLPKHHCFKIISHNALVLGGKYLRILICMEKIKEPNGDELFLASFDSLNLDVNEDDDKIPESVRNFKDDYHKNKGQLKRELKKED